MVMALGIVAALGWTAASLMVGFFLGFCFACYGIKKREEEAEEDDDDDEEEIEESADH